MFVLYICIFMPDDDFWEGPKHVALLTQALNIVMLEGITFINIESRYNRMNCNKNSWFVLMKMLLGWLNHGGWSDRDVWFLLVRTEMNKGFWWRNLSERSYLENLDSDNRKILKEFLKKY
jgi:hypothetical protein